MDRDGRPETVRLADGRTEPFEPERISRSLFAAAERLGRPDAFLARELTDGVLHFLATDDVGPVTSPERIAEIVGKVVRELGHPALAREYEQPSAAPGSPPGDTSSRPQPAWPDLVDPALAPAVIERELGRAQLRTSALAMVFPRDLAAAHAEGLIGLAGLEHPFELDGIVAPVPPAGILEGIAAARRRAGGFLAIDGPEYDLAALPGDPPALAESFLREAGFAAGAMGLRLILNLNVQSPPARIAQAAGPLFQTEPPAVVERRRAIARALLPAASEASCAVWWHMTGDPSVVDDCLEVVCQRAATGAAIEFVFDRPRGPVVLGPGVDRAGPASLIRVSLNLARLVELSGGPPVDSRVYLRKVGSLARFAKTAGHVKLDFLRKQGRPELREAFLLDRARLVLVPDGLGTAVRSAELPATEFARDILRTIRSAAENDRPRVLPVRLDSPLGPKNWGIALEPATPVRQQLRAWSPLHGITAAGRADVSLPGRESPGVEIREVVRMAAESALARVRIVRPGEAAASENQFGGGS